MTGRSVLGGLEYAYAVAGGPVGWLAQINIVYPLVATPCFPGPFRNFSFPDHAHWALILAVTAYVACLAFALVAALLAWRLYRQLGGTRREAGDHFEGSGAGRLRFLAFSGILLGAGFSFVILLNGFALLMVPPCAL